MMQRVVYQYYQGVVLLLDTTQVWPSQLMKSKKVLLLHLVHLSHPIQLMNKIHSVNFSRLCCTLFKNGQSFIDGLILTYVYYNLGFWAVRIILGLLY